MGKGRIELLWPKSTIFICNRCLEENRTLISMMAEKDSKIQFLELKIQQLTLVSTNT